MTVDSAFKTFPILETHRLRLRPVLESDAQALFAIKSDLDVTRQYGQEPHQAVEDTLRWILRLQADYEMRVALFWAITLKGDDAVIGAGGFWNFDPGFHCAEIGYELHPADQGQGIMTEALSAVLAFGFNELGLHRIEANPLADNAASRGLLFKLGFTFEGNLRQRVYFRGRFRDQYYFGFLKEEWLKMKPL